MKGADDNFVTRELCRGLYVVQDTKKDMMQASILESVLRQIQFSEFLIPAKASSQDGSTLRAQSAVIQIQLLNGLVLRNKQLAYRVIVTLDLVVLIEPEVVPRQVQLPDVLANLERIQKLEVAIDCEVVLR